MRVAIVPGHTMTGKGTGAVGYINESKENRILTDLIVKWLKQGGATVFYGKIDNSSNYLAEQVAIANKQSVDVSVQIHFNANRTTSSPVGTETLYVSNSGKVFADRVTTKLGTVFKQRGSKKRTDLYWLNGCKSPTILIETCFVDSKADTDIYNKDKDKVAKLIAEGILGKSISGSSTSTGGSTTSGGSYTVKINTDSLNVRTGPSTNYSVSATVKRGEVYTIVETKDGWGKLKSGAGWIKLSYTIKM